MTPFAAWDSDGVRCIVVAIASELLALVTYGGDGQLHELPISELHIIPNAEWPMNWVSWPTIAEREKMSA